MKAILVVKGDVPYTRSKNVKYKRKCNTCGKKYFGWGRYFCKKSCKTGKKGEEHHSWKGDNVTFQGGRQRAERMYKLEPCEICGSKKSERHHVDSNPLNNIRENIMFLCRKHHIAIEDRLVKMWSIRHPDIEITRHPPSTSQGL